eukprot:COSAG01_NODE_695_length_14201_cov_10.521875_17_plen_121_part_00
MRATTQLTRDSGTGTSTDTDSHAGRNPNLQNPEILTEGDRGEDPAKYSQDHVVGVSDAAILVERRPTLTHRTYASSEGQSWHDLLLPEWHMASGLAKLHKSRILRDTAVQNLDCECKHDM